MQIARWVIFVVAIYGISLISFAGEGVGSVDKAEIYQHGDIVIMDPWAKSAFGEHRVKLFFEFQNLGADPDRLTRIDSPINDGKSRMIAVHTTNDGVRTQQNIDSLEIPATQTTFELSEHGYYLVLENVSKPILMGSKLPVHLEFEKAGGINIDFTARFHSPSLSRRIKEAASSGDVETLKALHPRAEN